MSRSSLVRMVLCGVILISPFLSLQEAEACESCKRTSWLTPWNYLCKATGDRETGVTLCTDEYEPLTNTTYCNESGDFCTVVDAEGGGGSGGGSGGGDTSNPCLTTGFCPAECFSCSGGGGRPAV